MGDSLIMTEGLQRPYKIYKADSGAITFVIVPKSYHHQSSLSPTIYLIGKECPHEIIYKIKLDYSIGYIILENDEEGNKVEIPDCIKYVSMHNANMPQKCWLSWYNDTILIGAVESSRCMKPFFEYQKTSTKQLIGFIGFTVNKYIDWIVESSPVFLKPITHKMVNNGKLTWVKMTINKDKDDKLPAGALIGGFENEPLYIARARLRGSLCPGKYVPSKRMAFLPWGHMEHKKSSFEILCGFNATWVRCKKNFVPENAFVAGTSEVRGEDIYIGRAMIDDYLVVGKVHMLYKTCYLPYKGREVEMYNYEILVNGDVTKYGETCNKNCSLDPMKATQPCI